MKRVTLATKRSTCGGQYSSDDGLSYGTCREELAKCLFDHNMLGIVVGIGLCTVSKFSEKAVVTPLNSWSTYILTLAECSDYILAGGVFITENIGAKR